MQNLEALKKIRLFARLPDNVLQELAQAAIPLHCDDGQLIELDDAGGGAVFFVLEGIVRAYRSSLSGREQNLIHLEAGSAFNIPTAFSSQGENPASAACIGRVHLIKIPFNDFRRIVSRNPEAALAVLGDLSDKLTHLTQLTHNLSLRNVRARLAGFLLNQSRSDLPGGIQWTQTEIAAQIGSVREVISRTMRSFVREGLIRMDRQRIIILDEAGLQAEAENE